MSIPVQWLLAAFFAFVIGHILLRFARSIRTTVADDKLGKTVHVETSIGTFDLKPQENTAASGKRAAAAAAGAGGSSDSSYGVLR